MDASIGFVTQTGMDIPEAVRRAAKYSFDHVEILMEGNADHSRINTDAINHAASTHDLDIHVHLPFQLDIASPKQYVRDGSVREVIAAIETASTIGAGKAILHAGTRAWLDAWDPEDVKSHLLSSIQRLTQVANDHYRTLCGKPPVRLLHAAGRLPDPPQTDRRKRVSRYGSCTPGGLERDRRR